MQNCKQYATQQNCGLMDLCEMTYDRGIIVCNSCSLSSRPIPVIKVSS